MNPSAGLKLRQARQARNLTLEQAAQATHIRLRYLQALEAGEPGVLPSLAQARGFLRAYAGYLGLDPQDVIATVETEGAPSEPAAPASPKSAPASPNGQHFTEIGQALKRQRELLGLTLTSIEQQTHLRVHYLEALEAGSLDALPSPVQGRGMLYNYATFLGLDPDPLLLKFAEGLQARLAARQERLPATAPKNKQAARPSALRRFLSGDLVFGGLLVLALVVFVGWGVLRIIDVQAEQAQQTPTATAPSIAEVLLPTETPSPTFAEPTQTPGPTSSPAPESETAAPAENGPTPEAGTPTPTETPALLLPGASESAVQVTITVRQRAWMRVVVDGQAAFEGRVVPGGAFPFAGRESVQVVTGNGAALEIVFNQQNLGPMGNFGEVVNRIYTPQGVVFPTPTITPTPSITPTPEATATP